jgi:hypothetical protein
LPNLEHEALGVKVTVPMKKRHDWKNTTLRGMRVGLKKVSNLTTIATRCQVFN